MKNKVISLGSDSFPTAVMSDVEKKIAAIKAHNSTRQIHIGYTHDYSRISTRHDDETLWPEITYVRPALIKELCKGLDESQQQYIRSLRYHLFNTTLETNGSAIDGVINDDTRDVYIPKDLLRYLQNGKHHHRDNGEHLMDQHILHILSQRNQSWLSDRAKELLTGTYFDSTSLNKIREQAQKIVTDYRNGKEQLEKYEQWKHDYIEKCIQLKMREWDSEHWGGLRAYDFDLSALHFEDVSNQEIERIIEETIQRPVGSFDHSDLLRKDILILEELITSDHRTHKLEQRLLSLQKQCVRSCVDDFSAEIINQAAKTWTGNIVEIGIELAEHIINHQSTKTNNDYIEICERYTADLIKKQTQKKDLNLATVSLNVPTGGFKKAKSLFVDAALNAHREKANFFHVQELVITSYQTLDDANIRAYIDEQQKTIREINSELTKEFSKDLIVWLNDKLSGENKARIIEEFIKEMKKLDEEMLNSQITDSYDADKLTKQTLADLKQTKLSNVLKMVLEEHSIETAEIINQFNADYDEHGIAYNIPAFMPSGDSKPFNGMYVFRGDGSLALEVGKQEPVNDEISYFTESHHHKPGRRDIKNVFVWRGHKLGFNICEDIWQESVSKTVQKVTDTTGGLIQDPHLAQYENQGADHLFNSSASPEQLGKLVPYPLDNLAQEDWPKDLVFVGGKPYVFRGPRSKVRIEDLVATIAKHMNVNIGYTNSLGVIDHIDMGGGAYFLNRFGDVVCSAPQFKESILYAKFDRLGNVIPLDEASAGDQTHAPLQQLFLALSLYIKDYFVKNDIDWIDYRPDGSHASDLIQHLIIQANKLIDEETINHFKAQYNVSLAEVKRSDQLKFIKGKRLKSTAYFLPFNPLTLRKELIQMLRGIKLLGSHVYGSIPLMMHLTGAYEILNWLSAGGTSSLLQMALMLLAFALINTATDIVRSIIRNVNILMHQDRKPVIEGLKSGTRSLSSIIDPHSEETKKGWQKRTEWCSRIFKDPDRLVDLYRGVNIRVNQELTKRFWGRKSLFVSSLTENEALLASFAKGGLFSSGILPFVSVTRSIISLVLLDHLERQLAKERSPKKLKTLHHEWQRLTRELTNTDLSSREKIFSTRTYVLQQRRLSLNRILSLSTEANNNNKYMTKLRKELRSIEGELNNKTVTPLKTPKKLRNKEIERFNVPAYIQEGLNRILLTEDYSRMAFMKPVYDPSNLLSNEEYAKFIAYHVRRHQSTVHKAPLQGPWLHLNVNGSKQETISKEPMPFDAIVGNVKKHLNFWQSSRMYVNTLENYDSDTWIIKESGNKWVDRSPEKEAISKAIMSITEHAQLILTSLATPTDKEALDLAKQQGIITLALLTLEELASVSLSDQMFGSNQKYIIFDNDKLRADYIKDHMTNATEIRVG